MSVKVLLADDHAIIRQGLRSLIEKEKDIEVAGEANDGQEVLTQLKELRPDIVIMDVTMPKMNGFATTAKLHKDYPKVKVIALSIHSNSKFVGGMLEAGAWGYVLKDDLFGQLVEAIRTVANGGTYLSPKIATVVVGDYVKRLSKDASSHIKVLNDREREVLQMLTEGKSTKEIAIKLNVSPKTIEVNRRQIMEKLNIHSVAELTKYAIREGVTPL